ncbi:MAG: DUF177 domain-containing protein [Candidatus Omnitrophica bacterium]|nr:DUF177 domain-containing protein [Candidatus Omnitrophota bacterium]
MKINVSQILEGGSTQSAVYDPAGMDMDRTDVHLREPIQVEASILKTGQELIVNTQVHCPLHLTCARCLEEYAFELDVKAMSSYHVAPTDVVDITDDVRQEIILAYPMIPVCREDCKGLCISCGQNLNVAACSHQMAR